MKSREFSDLLKSIDQARKIQRAAKKNKKKVTTSDRVFPKGTIRISKERNRGYSRSNTSGR